MSLFRPAVKHTAKLRLAIAGPSGSGKTYTALSVATALGDKIAVVDTEHGSASKYADIFEFDVAEMHAPFHPDKYIDAIQQAGAAGYDVIILDSLSHAWNGSGGLLEIVDAASRRYKGNSYAAWGEGTPIQNRLIEAIVQADLHLIATMRSKQDYILVERNGKQVPQKVGMAPIQRDSMEYEFDVYIDMDMENNGIVQKTRCSALTGAVLSKPGADLAETLRDWLQGEPAPEPTKPEPTKAEKETVEFDDLASASDTTATNGSGDPYEAAKKMLKGGRTSTLAQIGEAAIKTGFYDNQPHAWNTIKLYDWPDSDKFELVPDQKVSNKTALEVLDWMIQRKLDEAEDEGALFDMAHGIE